MTHMLNVGKLWETVENSDYWKQCKEQLEDVHTHALIGKAERKKLIARTINDLIWRGINGQLSQDSVVQMLVKLVLLRYSVLFILLDVFRILHAGTFGSSEEHAKFAYIVKETERILSERLKEAKKWFESGTQQGVDTAKNSSAGTTRASKVKAKL